MDISFPLQKKTNIIVIIRCHMGVVLPYGSKLKRSVFSCDFATLLEHLLCWEPFHRSQRQKKHLWLPVDFEKKEYQQQRNQQKLTAGLPENWEIPLVFGGFVWVVCLFVRIRLVDSAFPYVFCWFFRGCEKLYHPSWYEAGMLPPNFWVMKKHLLLKKLAGFGANFFWVFWHLGVAVCCFVGGIFGAFWWQRMP